MNSHITLSSNYDSKTSGNFLQPNSKRGCDNKNNGLINSKIHKTNSQNPFLTTPSSFEPRSFYSRVNTSPAKEKLSKLEEEEEKEDQGDRTLKRVNFPFANYKEENIFFNSNFFSENSSVPKQVKFSANSGVRTQVRFLCSAGEVPYIKQVDSKPSLNRLESINNLIAFSKGKYFEEDSPNVSSSIIINLQNQIIQNKEDETKEEIKEQVEESNEEEEEVNTDPYTARLLEIQKNLPVPIDRKDDEKFKILKMREMKKESVSANKSTQIKDLQTPPHQRSFQNGMINNFNKYYLLLKTSTTQFSEKRN
jgi:hypothetical protein